MRIFLVINYNLMKEKDAKYNEVDVSNIFQLSSISEPRLENLNTQK